MTIKAVFVGINKHSHKDIPELSGATRDAIAMYSLFIDSIHDISAQLLTDETATRASLNNSILETLSTANNDENIIIFFAGHGSPDGSLIAFDTDLERLSATSISMTLLADAFKATKARNVLCVLDCCFSGQAPARVLEVGIQPRNAFVLNGISGEGRILLTACSTTEAAWEQSGTGHGLLTYALINAFTQEDKSTISFPDIIGDIITTTRIAAERMGVKQTPTFLGTVKGGMVFPMLKKRASYLAAFPNKLNVKISSAFDELSKFGIHNELINGWKNKFPGGLNDLQLKAINEKSILNGDSLLVVAPTSSGKTMIGELGAIRAISSGKKAVFLLPYRALVNEKFDEFTERFGPAGLRIVRCSGDNADGIGPVLKGKYDIGIFTYETFLNMALLSPYMLTKLGLVVVDEAQFITDPTRGITVELIFALLIRAREREINPQLLILSAVIGNLNNFDQWLGIPTLVTKTRPVPLIEGVLDRQGNFEFVGVDGSTKMEQLIPRNRIIQRRDAPSSQDVIVPLAKELVGKGERIIVFRNTRGPAQGCAKYLSKELGLQPATSVLNSLPTQDLTSASRDLRECLNGGVAFHNTNLLRAEREAVEKSFRDPAGEIHALAATTTLAAGVNTPASTVILAENEFVGEDGRAFTVAEYKNMAGRAGRLGFNEIGKSIILAETPMERTQLFHRYVLGLPENVISSFNQRDLPTWVIRLLSQVRGLRIEDVPTLLVNTFGGYTASKNQPEWIAHISIEVSEFIQRLLAAGLAEMEGDIIHLTLLGKACGASSLKFESSLRLVELMQNADISQASAIHLLAIIQVLEEMENVYTPIMKRGRTESKRMNEAALRYGNNILRLLQRYSSDEFEVWKRCKRAAILCDWIEGVSIGKIEQTYTTTPFQGAVGYGDIMRIVEGTRFHLRSGHQILSALFPDQAKFLASLDNLLKRLEFGVPENAMDLIDLPTPLSRGQYLALFNAGFTTIEQVQDINIEKLSEIVGPSTAKILSNLVALQAQ